MNKILITIIAISSGSPANAGVLYSTIKSFKCYAPNNNVYQLTRKESGRMTITQKSEYSEMGTYDVTDAYTATTTSGAIQYVFTTSGIKGGTPFLWFYKENGQGITTMCKGSLPLGGCTIEFLAPQF